MIRVRTVVNAHTASTVHNQHVNVKMDILEIIVKVITNDYIMAKRTSMEYVLTHLPH